MFDTSAGAGAVVVEPLVASCLKNGFLFSAGIVGSLTGAGGGAAGAGGGEGTFWVVDGKDSAGVSRTGVTCSGSSSSDDESSSSSFSLSNCSRLSWLVCYYTNFARTHLSASLAFSNSAFIADSLASFSLVACWAAAFFFDSSLFFILPCLT